MKEIKGFKSSPLVSCVVEIRFKHGAGELVPGLVYGAVSNRYGNPNIENFPILQLPQQAREADPNLMFQPYNAIRAKSFSLNVGPRVLALNYDVSSGKRYPGWKAFFVELETLSNELAGIGLFKNIERIGIRYVDFFQTINFLENTTFKLTSPWDDQREEDVSVGIIARNKSSKTRITINTNAILTTNRAGVLETKNGQILDTDTFVEKSIRYQDLLPAIDGLHTDAISVFRKSITEEFLESLGPEYEE